MSALPRVPLLLALLVASAGAPADEPAAAPDLSAWPCRFCQFESGASGWVEPRLGYISDDSFRFGDYTGLEEQGGFLDLGGAWRYRGEDGGAEAWDLHAERLGLDSRALGLRGGRQGTYRVSLGYEALPHLVAADSRTIFAGTDALALPPGWTRAGSTGGMTALDASLRGAELRQERERTALGLEFTPHRAADLRFDYRRDEIHGTGATGGSFMTLASQLPRPVDQTIDRADVSVGFHHTLGQAQLALASSFFSNNVDALAWQNPYSGPVSGATTGQMAQAPDNRAHRLSLTLGSALGTDLHASAQLAVGQLTQDQRFLPATVNPDETAVLPRESLDGRVDTTFASLRAVYAFCPTTRALADFLHDKRDNRTPVAAYTQVVMDTFTGDVRSNAPYGSLRQRWRFSVEDHTIPRLRWALGVEDENRERRFYGAAETQESRYWGRIGWRPVAGSDLRLRLAHAERDGTELGASPAAAAQNPLLRAFNTAARDRDEARADFAVGSPRVTTTLNVLYARDKFPDTVVGRTERNDFGYGADLAVQAGEALAISAFASRRLQDTEQAGSQGFGAPDWFAEQEDATTVMGTHLAWQASHGLELGADYVYSESEGTITTFPLLVTRWHNARLFGRYPLRPDLALRLDLVRERYQASDWAIDDVGPDTMGNLLALGQGTQSGSVTAVVLGLRYEFKTGAPAAD